MTADRVIALSVVGIAVVLCGPAHSANPHDGRLLPSRPIFEARLAMHVRQPVVYRNDVLPDHDSARANALYQRGLARQKAGDLAGARRDLEAATALAPENAAIRASLGYVQSAAGDLEPARTAFQAALKRDPSMASLYAEIGYLDLRLGDNRDAARWFRTAADRYAAAPASSADAAARAERIYRMRSEVAQIEDDIDIGLYSVFRPGANGPLNPTGRSLTQSQGGLEGSVRLPLSIGPGRTIQAFGRVLWGYKPDSLHVLGDSYQGGFGLRIKPLASQNLVLSMERLVSLGSAARDDWLARAGYSWSLGYGFDPFKKRWPFILVYGDAALAFPTGPDLFLTGEIRLGESWRLGDRVSLTPHFVLAGSRQEDGAVTTTLIEGGPGVALKYYFDETTYRAFRASAEVVLQYRAKLAGSSTGTSGAAATMVLSF